jgi:hypothetical protein
LFGSNEVIRMRAMPSIAGAIGAGLLTLSALSPSHAEVAAARLDDADRRAVVETAAEALRDRYVYPEVGAKAAAALEASLAAGRYDKIDDPNGFADRLTSDLKGVSHDLHLFVSAPVPPHGPDRGPPPGMPPRPFSEAGVVRADRLAGNVGYLQVFAFGPAAMFKPPLDRAMAALAGARALIVDVRFNVGGDPEAVDYLLSYFIPRTPALIGRSVSRTPGTNTFTTQEYWVRTRPAVPYAGKPVFVLASRLTFSGGEALVSNMKKLKLGTIVGETTAGGANITSTVPIARGFEISVPYARSEGPSWEGSGVPPDIASPAADALKTALRKLGQTPDSDDIDVLSQARLFTPRTTAAPGGEAAARRMIEELESGSEPDYARLNEVMAKVLHDRLPELKAMFAGKGPIQSLTFVEIDPVYGDVYRVKLANGEVYWSIALDADGKVVMWQVRPVS